MSKFAINSMNALRTFEAVARHRNVTQGARELGVTQSAASHQIRKLEEYLGASLFDRQGRKISLTPSGEVLWDGVRDGLALIADAIDKVRSDKVSRPFGLHVRPHFALKWLAPRLVRLWQKYPGLDLRLQHSNFPADFSDRSIDLAIEWRHRDAARPNTTLLLAGELTPACHPSLLTEAASTLRPEDLTSFALLHEVDERTWNDWFSHVGCPGIRAERNHYFDDTNVRQQAAINGEGFALVCPSLVRDELSAGLLMCPFPDRLDSYGYYLVVPTHGVERPATRMVRRWLIEEAKTA